jgi:hypothetical protein
MTSLRRTRLHLGSYMFCVGSLWSGTELIVSYRLRASVSQLHVADATQWQTYFTAGGSFHGEA